MHERDGDIELSVGAGKLACRLIESYYHVEACGEAQVALIQAAIDDTIIGRNRRADLPLV